jgi:hypothetical protein
MQRLRRWLVNGFVAVSLLLCALGIIFWTGSYFISDDFLFSHRQTLICISSRPHVAILTIIRDTSAFPNRSVFVPTKQGFSHQSTISRGYNLWPLSLPWHGFGWEYRGSLPWPNYFQISFPFWFLVPLLGGVASAPWWPEAFRQILHKKGHCVRCGYDLRATPDRCPECGRIPQID